MVQYYLAECRSTNRQSNQIQINKCSFCLKHFALSLAMSDLAFLPAAAATNAPYLLENKQTDAQFKATQFLS